MSFVLAGRFLETTTAMPAARFIGLVMASASADDGICWLNQDELSRRTGMSESSVRRAIRHLEERGELETRSAIRKAGKINVYRLCCGESPQYDRLPFAVDEPFTATTGQFDRQSNAKGLPVKSVGGTGHGDRQSPLTSKERKERDTEVRAWKVDGKSVTDSEADLARRVLVAWNAHTGQTLTARDWLSMIVRRQREHWLSTAEHEDLIAANLAKPWWDGPPSPNVVYGSGAQFERALTIAAAPEVAGDEEHERARFARILGGRR